MYTPQEAIKRIREIQKKYLIYDCGQLEPEKDVEQFLARLEEILALTK